MGKVIAAALLSLVMFSVALTLLLELPAVQNFVVDKAAAAVSRRLGTAVRIGHVRITRFTRIEVEDFYVEDFQHDTLLYAGRAEAVVRRFGFSGGGLALGEARIENARLCLHETPEGELNIKQVVARLSRKKKKKREANFRLTIASARIDGMTFCLERLQPKNPPYGIDFSHLHLTQLAGEVEELTIDGTAIHMTIRSLSGRERSGFALDDFSGRFYLNNGCIGFSDLALRTARSALRMPEVSLVGGSWSEYRHFIDSVRLDASVRGSTLATEDLAYFVPKLAGKGLVLTSIDCDAEGTVSDFTADVRDLRTGESTRLAARAEVRGLPDMGQASFDLDLRTLATEAGDLERIAGAFVRDGLPSGALRIARNAGSIALAGRFAGRLSAFRMQAALRTDAGRADCNLRVRPVEGHRRSVLGDVTAQELRLGRLLGSRRLGEASAHAYIDGVLGRGYAEAQVRGEVAKFEFNGYGYDSIRFDGRLSGRRFDGAVTARDPGLDFDFAGMVDLNDSVPNYDFGLDLRHADLALLRINPRDSVSVLRARVKAKAAGRSLDDLNGRIRITDASYRYNDSSVAAREIVVRGENSAHSKFLSLQSDFADVTFRSKTSYREVFRYLRMSAWKYLPMLGTRERASQHEAAPSAADDYSLLSVEIKRINPLVDAVARGLQVADGSHLRLLFNPASDRLSLTASSDYVERGRLLAARIRINASNRGDSLAFYAATEDLYAGMLHLRDLSLTGGARDGRVQLSAGFDDTLRRMSGLFALRAQLESEPGPDGPVLGVRILPSHLRRDSTVWRIFARSIRIDTARIAVDRFTIRNNGQELLVDGCASRDRGDSVTLRLRNFEISPFTQLLDRMGYGIGGVINGSASVKSAMHAAEVAADLRFDSLAVNGIAAPPLQLVSRWDFQRNRAGVVLRNPVRSDTLVRGYFVPSEVRYYARADVDSLDLGLLDPVLRGVVSGTKGYASGRLTLAGERRRAELRGGLRVRGLSTTVDFTRTTYEVPDVRLEVAGNRLRASDVPVYDTEGNDGLLDFELDLSHLSNIAYRVRVEPHAMLVLNTTSRDNDLFYGRVYASGAATIAGDKRGVNMDIAAVTEDNSSFNMPLSGKTNIVNADFVTFESAARADTTDLLARKKQLFERRRKERTSSGGAMNITLALDVRPNLDFQLETSGNIIRGRGQGALNLQIAPRRNLFEMYGDYTITEGTVLFSLRNLISRRFTVEDGSTIQWTGAPLSALLDISAVYRLKTSLAPLLAGTTTSTVGSDRSVPVECVIHLGDRLANPDVTFDVRVPSADTETQTVVANALSSPETVNTQFFYLLVFNSFMSETNTAMAELGASASAATGISFLTNMLSKWLSFDGYNLLFNYRPKSELTSDELDFGLSKSLINNRLFVEVEGNYLLDDAATVNRNMSNFMGEANITWLIDRAGTLKLRGFTQTIDRFDENQGLQETGIGIYYKEDFNNFRDLCRRIRERFTGRKRRARRQAERRAAAEAAQRAADSLRTDEPDAGLHRAVSSFLTSGGDAPAEALSAPEAHSAPEALSAAGAPPPSADEDGAASAPRSERRKRAAAAGGTEKKEKLK